MRLSRLFPALLTTGLSLAFFACQDPTTGTSDEHETSMARLYRTDGTPAARAKMKFYSVSDTAQVPAALTYTTENGDIQLPELPAGMYNAVASDGSGAAALLDSIVFSANGKASVLSDTLKPMGVLRGRVVVQPQHSPQIAWIQVMGMGVATNVDSLGRFEISLPAGRATIYALTREAHYTPTFQVVTAGAGGTQDLGDIRLIYTSIPVVTGLRAKYDDRTGVVSVTWNRILSGSIAGYRLEINGETRQFNVEDTAFEDTVFTRTKFDSVSKVRKISIEARDTNGIFGDPWRRVELVANSPFTIQRATVQWDSIGSYPSICSDLDTLEGGLVCLEKWKYGRSGGMAAPDVFPAFMDLKHADSLRVWTSKDGVSWIREAGIWKNVMATVLWRGALWIVQGGDTASVAVDSLHQNQGGLGVLRYAVFRTVAVSSWSLRGELFGIDTIRPPSPLPGYRLAVARDTLLLSADSVSVTTPSVFWGLWPSSKNAWKRVGISSQWEGVRPEDFPSLLDRYQINARAQRLALESTPKGGIVQVPDFDDQNPSELPGGIQVASDLGGKRLFLKEASGVFPWFTSLPVDYRFQPFYTYRGNGHSVPEGLPFQGGRVFYDSNLQRRGIWKLSLKP